MHAIRNGQVVADTDKTEIGAGYDHFLASTTRLDLRGKAPKTEADLACPHNVQFYDVVSGIQDHLVGAAVGVLTTMQRGDNAIGMAVLETPFAVSLDHARLSVRSLFFFSPPACPASYSGHGTMERCPDICSVLNVLD